MEKPNEQGLSRRGAIAAGLVGAAGLAGITAVRAGSPAPQPDGDAKPVGLASSRMPVVYFPHGGGPWPFVEMGLDPADVAKLTEYLRSLRAVTNVAPRALLVLSAHWEEPVPTVMTAARPPILYDYFGFPPASYQITWPAPGDPALAMRVR